MSELSMFLLEDSQVLLDETVRLAKRLGWQVICASSLEQAEKVCAKGNMQIDAALIDLMLPRTEDDLNKVNKLLKRRETESEKLTERGAKPEEKAVARAQLEAIDSNIMRLIADNGGIEFLNTECGKKQFCDTKITVGIFTALKAEPENKTTQERLKDSVSKALGQTPVTWFEKPIEPIVLEDWLKEIAKSR